MAIECVYSTTSLDLKKSLRLASLLVEKFPIIHKYLFIGVRLEDENGQAIWYDYHSVYAVFCKNPNGMNSPPPTLSDLRMYLDGILVGMKENQ